MLDVLRLQPGGEFDAGLINGPRGKGRLAAIRDDALELEFAWAGEPPALPPVHLVVGMVRPQTVRDVLRDAATLGVAALHFVLSERSDPNYARSTVWEAAEVERLLVAGAAQAFSTRLPVVHHGRTLAETVTGLPAGSRFALDNYEGTQDLGAAIAGLRTPVTLAVGPERGWTNAERELFRAHDFHLAHLGTRVLRTETACLAGITLLLAKLGWP